MWKPAAVLAIVLVLAACGSIPDRNPIPPELGETARIPGIPLARCWGDTRSPTVHALETMSDEEVREAFAGVYGKPHHYLALSGGGANGAFGAGLLNGWTEAGTRPEFTIVTGISTGALIAPFAFLGSEYDGVLKHFYTTVTTKDVLRTRRPLVGLTSDAMTDSEPLKNLIAGIVDEKLLAEVAAAHRSGRRLLIGTVNLDAMRPVVWNMGEIAISDAPQRLELFRSVLLASASIPGAFPPVLIPVEGADGKTYDEVHVDGGCCAQVFLLPSGLDWNAVRRILAVPGRPQVWVIRNALLDPKWKTLDLGLMDLVGRSISSLIRTQGLGDVYRIWVDARENGMAFHLAHIPAAFDREPEEPFDSAYMNALYDTAFRLAREGYPWDEAPPEEHEVPPPVDE